MRIAKGGLYFFKNNYKMIKNTIYDAKCGKKNSKY